MELTCPLGAFFTVVEQDALLRGEAVTVSDATEMANNAVLMSISAISDIQSVLNFALTNTSSWALHSSTFALSFRFYHRSIWKVANHLQSGVLIGNMQGKLDVNLAPEDPSSTADDRRKVQSEKLFPG